MCVAERCERPFDAIELKPNFKVVQRNAEVFFPPLILLLLLHGLTRTCVYYLRKFCCWYTYARRMSQYCMPLHEEDSIDNIKIKSIH